MKQSIILFMGLVVIGFQNFTYVDWASLKLTPINESMREKHAKELLGSQYKKISLKKSKKNKSKLHQKIHQLIQENLSPENQELSLDVSKAIIHESQKYQLDPLFVLAVIQTESHYNPKARGSHGEIGLMQIKPDTAEWIADKFDINYKKSEDLEDPVKNIQLGTAYLSYLREYFPEKPQRYIAAYNMGPMNVKRLMVKKLDPKDYPGKVLENYKKINFQLSDKVEASKI